jgi:(4S)-4-hydroxy-5-phosphonooxypentane-2,3-dione isomerase
MAQVIIARWVAREGEEEAIAATLAELAEASRQEPGVLEFRPHRGTEDPRLFVLYERYVDAAAIEAHGESAHFRHLVLERAVPLLESRERTYLTDSCVTEST